MGGPACGRASTGRASTGWITTGWASRAVTPPEVPANADRPDADRPGPTAGSGGSRGSRRHGAARGSSGGNPPVTGGADADVPSLGRTGDAPGPPMRTLGSAHRLNAVRGPRASGHPPWEPAEKPVSELPWMDAPGSGQSRMVPPRRVFPVGAEGQAPGSAGRPGCGRDGRRRPGSRNRIGASTGTSTGTPGPGDRHRLDRRARSRRPWPVHDRLRADPPPSQEPEPIPRPERSARGAGGSARCRICRGGRGAEADVLLEPVRSHRGFPGGSATGRLTAGLSPGVVSRAFTVCPGPFCPGARRLASGGCPAVQFRLADRRVDGHILLAG